LASIHKDWLLWLYWHKQGESIQTIMELADRSQRTVYHGLQRAKEFLEREKEIQALNEGEILLQMVGVTGRQCQHGRPTSFLGTMLCLDCWYTNNPRRRALNQGLPLAPATSTEYQPKGKPKFKPRQRKKAK